MSVYLMGQVWKRYGAGGGELLLALALADHAHDDGTHVHPSVGLLAEKTRQSERTIQRHLRNMEASGWLRLSNSGKGGRRTTNLYCIDPAWVNGDKLSPIETGKGDNVTPLETEMGDILTPISQAERVTSETERVTSETKKGDTAMSPEPSYNHQEPPISARVRARGGRADKATQCVQTMRARYPARAGSQRWADAEHHIRSLLRTGVTAQSILDGVARYAAWCSARGIVGSDKVQQAATFVGSNRGFLEPWPLPAAAEKPLRLMSDSELLARAGRARVSTTGKTRVQLIGELERERDAA